jgi:cytochrome c biogenesis protein CcmG, thiol:disulfide interchange protein DsbE
MKTKTLGIVIVALAVVVAAVLVVMSRSSSEASSSSSGSAVTVMAPADFKVADYAGKPLVLNMFGSWCPPCNMEAPDLATFAEQNPGAQVVGIACEDTEKDAVAFMEKYGLTYPMVLDDGSLVQEFAITAYPTTIFFDAQGKEVDRLVGAASLDQFNASLAKAQ